jgi:hypothetical protein
MHQLFRPVISYAIGFLSAAALVFAVQPARGDDFTNIANARFAEISPDRRSDTILLPLIAQMTPPPRSVVTLENAILLPPQRAGWSEAEAWATAPPQAAVLAAISKVSQERDWKRAYGFGQPYGIDGIDPAMVRTNLYTDLGDPPTLAGARFHYLTGLDRVALLVHVEATRLTAAGRVSDAIDLLTNWGFFARQICDRQFYKEASWALHQLSVAFERIRDVAYVDSRTTRKLDTARLRAQIDRMTERGQFLDLGRMKFPAGNRAAADQLIARLYKPDGTADDRQFAATMSRLGSSKHPLRLFSESGKWRSLASGQADKVEARAQCAGVFDDWAIRWNIPGRFDPRLSVATTYSKLDGPRFAAITAATGDMARLLDERDLARVEIGGTRCALGLIGFYTVHGNYPPQLTPIRPLWMEEIPDDIFNPMQRDRGARPPLSYFVPIRDTADFDGPGNPHEVQVFVVGQNFTVSLRDDVFVLYSFGSDLAKNNAKRVQNVADRVEGADYLMWPPVISLFRQHRLDTGDFK